jgi:hypothetical protein
LSYVHRRESLYFVEGKFGSGWRTLAILNACAFSERCTSSFANGEELLRCSDHI